MNEPNAVFHILLIVLQSACYCIMGLGNSNNKYDSEKASVYAYIMSAIINILLCGIIVSIAQDSDYVTISQSNSEIDFKFNR
jgi:hypothetical protein